MPGAARNAVFNVLWACCLQGELFCFFKLLSLIVRQAPNFNKFIVYLKVVDPLCVSCELYEKQKQMSVLLLSPSQGGNVSCLTWTSVIHTPELLKRRGSTQNVL